MIDSRRHLRTPEQIEKMREAGLVVWQAHQEVSRLIAPGITTGELNAAVEAYLASVPAVALFKGVRGVVPFPAATCISVNDEVVHGIPGPRVIHDGDVVGIDIGAKIGGWCGDAAFTHAIGRVDPTSLKLLEITEGSLRMALQLLGTKKRWSEVAREMSRYVRAAGFSVVTDLVGHNIGQTLWDGLQLPNQSSRQFERDGDFELRPGLVLAIEPMINVGTADVHALEDHWTIVTADGKNSAHFEHTIALTEDGPRVLTCGPNGEGWALGDA